MFFFPSITSPINTAIFICLPPLFSHTVALLYPGPAPFKSYLRNKQSTNPSLPDPQPHTPPSPLLQHKLTRLQHSGGN